MSRTCISGSSVASGGYRKPTNPAPASGPGRLSKRTDGGPGQKLMVASGQDYGERQQTLAQERTAPMSQADNITPAAVPSPSQATAGGAAPQGMNFAGPTTRPNEPITHGVDIGAGGGSLALPAAAQPVYQQLGPMGQMLSQLSSRDQTGALAQLYQSARAQGV